MFVQMLSNGEEEEEEEEEKKMRPPWLKPLLGTNFFVHCESHGDSSNMYCLDCMLGAMCSFCLTHHRDHHVIQIRRSSYHDVIRVSEIQKVLDIAGVQTYIINSARVVFLNQRPQPRPGKGVANTCLVCERSILDNCNFCSLGCKFTGTQLNLRTKGNMQREQLKRHGLRPMKGFSDGNTDNNKEYSAKEMYPPMSLSQSPSNHRTNKRRKGVPHRAPLGG
ncbi:protein RGF1 INDUCIBLE TRANSCRIPTION FACTOR 1 [Cryptomeria japonica]|uniref:protein RGF1 INDUCIBLE TRANSCRIPTION FACTOR 1 n=1 Tax=Cryptomeria japonica TaxID=3369 RepID=UPI0025AD5D2A|nr:protein RGF1 INDUCIBLE TRANSCRIPTION FACTOR 1 [Cryptomeria japonica]